MISHPLSLHKKGKENLQNISQRRAQVGQNPSPNTGNILLTEAQFQQLLQAVQRSSSTIPTSTAQTSTMAPFALSLALINLSKPIDFSTSEGAKLNKSAIENLSLKFDLKSASINAFNEVLLDRCGSTGWNKGDVDILTIPTLNGDLNLIKDFGQVSMDEIKQHVATYTNEETRKAQHQYQMYQCIMNSLTDTARLKIVKESNKYFINNIR